MIELWIYGFLAGFGSGALTVLIIYLLGRRAKRDRIRRGSYILYRPYYMSKKED